MSLRSLVRTVSVLAFLTAAAAPVVRAQLDVDLGAEVRLGDRARLFFSVDSRYFGQDIRAVERWSARYPNPDDLVVALFLAKESGRSPDVAYALRRQGLSWWDVGIKFGIPFDRWFLPVTTEPGPPFGNAYGSWRKHQQNPAHLVVLADADVRNLVAARMLHEYYGIPIETAMKLRASGRNIRDLVADEYETRHGKGKGRQPVSQGADEGKGQDKHPGKPGGGKQRD